ncbi:MAG: hypothetical protein KJ558_03165 [Gammaproteobacteria bacterium]|nr:hypothetical protein [Gammaproteobacteria bacterium]MBU1962154.1 hypothetical protein [Gammaproteobacteria bacterium]
MRSRVRTRTHGSVGRRELRLPLTRLAPNFQQTMELAVPKGLNHLPDDLIQQAIEALR